MIAFFSVLEISYIFITICLYILYQRDCEASKVQETSLRARILPRVFVFLKIVSILFCLGHFVFSIIFFAQNAYFFGVYNILSTIFYAVLCVSMSTLTADNVRRVSCVLTHMIIELKLFVWVALFSVGSDYGFQHYIYGIFVFIMFENYLSANTKKSIQLVILSCICTLVPSLLLYYIDTIYPSNEYFSTAFDIVNPLAVIILFISYIFIFSNIITQFEDDIIFQAYHDKLTGLNNRTLMNQLSFNKEGTYVAILDIDDFKKVNDTWGHDVGDLVLKHLSRVLSLGVRTNTGLNVMRWGGEEFVLVYDGEKNFLDIINAVRDDILQGYVTVDVRHLSYRITVGVADFEDGDDIEELIKVADDRLYMRKKTGKNKIVYNG